MIQPTQQNNTSLNLTQPIQEATVPSRFNQLSVNNVKSETSTFIGQGPSDKAATNATMLQIANDLSPCLTGYDLELQGMNTIFYNFCKMEDQESGANQLDSILKKISYTKVFLCLSTSWTCLEYTPFEKSTLLGENNYPLIVASAYGNLPMFKVILKYLATQNILKKIQQRFVYKDYSIDQAIKSSFDLAIKAGNLNIVKYIYTTFNSIISTSSPFLFEMHIVQALEIVNHVDVFKFLYETVVADFLKEHDSKRDIINLFFVKNVAKKAEKCGNQELLDYIKTLNINFEM